MTDKSISLRAGRNIAAIVDSYKRNMTIGTGSESEVGAKHLESLLQSILESGMSEEQKTAAAETVATISRDMSPGGEMAAKTKILWSGLRKAIETVPGAVKAWEALEKLWG